MIPALNQINLIYYQLMLLLKNYIGKNSRLKILIFPGPFFFNSSIHIFKTSNDLWSVISYTIIAATESIFYEMFK